MQKDDDNRPSMRPNTTRETKATTTNAVSTFSTVVSSGRDDDLWVFSWSAAGLLLVSPSGSIKSIPCNAVSSKGSDQGEQGDWGDQGDQGSQGAGTRRTKEIRETKQTRGTNETRKTWEAKGDRGDHGARETGKTGETKKTKAWSLSVWTMSVSGPGLFRPCSVCLNAVCVKTLSVSGPCVSLGSVCPSVAGPFVSKPSLHSNTGFPVTQGCVVKILQGAVVSERSAF